MRHQVTGRDGVVVTGRIAAAIALELTSATLVNLAYVREQGAASALPALSLRRPSHSLALLLTNRRWLGGFAMESAGFAMYVGALALASVSLVQTVGAGGIGVLAYASARLGGHRLGRRETAGIAIALVGLIALGVSLAGGAASGGSGHTTAILAWLGVTALLALAVLALGRRAAPAVAYGLAAGLLFSIGDISTKVATQGGVRFAFAGSLIVGYVLGTSLLQLGYQAGAALTVAGLATLLTNVLPILAGTIVLHEPVPSGALGALRILAFVAVTLGAVLLARPDGAVPEAAAPAT